jgi:hypothetical protein
LFALEAHFVVEVRPRAVARRAYGSNGLPFSDFIASVDKSFIQMAVHGGKPVTMIDEDQASDV